MVTIRCGVVAQQARPVKAVAGKLARPQRPAAASVVYRALLEVEDNGPGIAPADRIRVLERFFRMPGTKAEGTGLGLPIAREIAIRHRSELLLSDGIPHESGAGCGLRASILLAPDLLLTFNAQDVAPPNA